MVWAEEKAEAEVVTEQEQAPGLATEKEQAPEQAQQLVAAAQSNRDPRSLDSRYHHTPRE